MKFSRHPGIRLKVTLAFSLVFAALSVLMNLYSYRKIRQLIIKDNDRYLLARAGSLLDKTEVDPVIIPLPDKNASLKVFSRRKDGRRLLLFQSPGAVRDIPARSTAGVTDTLGLRVAYVINTSDENPAELLLVVSGQQLRTTLRYLLLLLLLSTMLSVLVSGLIAFWLAGFFLQPVQRIIDKTKTINAGDLRERVQVKESNDELQELSETINGMLARIDLSLQQQQNFFASASHELKTPLAVMRAELEVRAKQQDITPSLQALVASQLEEIVRLQNIVDEFLLISQIKADKLTLHPQRFDLSELCLKVVRQLKGSTTVNLHFDEETESFEIFADKEKLRLVISNLLTNALKYGVAGQPVNFQVKLIGREGFELIIENSIPQFAVETDQLTEAFYRGDILQSGAGVGLWLCKELIQAQKGMLRLDSCDHLFTATLFLPV